MARTIKDANLISRTARAKLAARREPYWARLQLGCYVGYRRTPTCGTWIARWRGPDGKQRYSALGPSDDVLDADGLIALTFDQAQAKARDFFHRIASQTLRGSNPGPYSVADCLKDYLAWARERRKSAHYMEKNAARFILPRLGAVDAAGLTSKMVDEWMSGLVKDPPPPPPRSGRRASRPRAEHPEPAEAERLRKLRANRQLTLLRAALNWSKKKKLFSADGRPWMESEKFGGVERARTGCLSVDEAGRLIDACPDDFRPLVGVALLTGARYGELCRLRVEDFHPASRSLYVGETKGGKPRHIPLNDQAVALCRSLSEGRPATAPLLTRADGRSWGAGNQVRLMRQAVAAADVKRRFTFHGLRHTWASLALMNGASLMVAARVLGHADTKMVESHYGHLHDRYLLQEVASKAPSYSSEHLAALA